jgi:hypothetical protein
MNQTSNNLKNLFNDQFNLKNLYHMVFQIIDPCKDDKLILEVKLTSKIICMI